MNLEKELPEIGTPEQALEKMKNSYQAFIDSLAKFITIAADTEKSAAKALTPLTGVESSEWLGDITGEKLGKIVESLGKAGVPQAYTDLLDQLLEESFG